MQHAASPYKYTEERVEAKIDGRGAKLHSGNACPFGENPHHKEEVMYMADVPVRKERVHVSVLLLEMLAPSVLNTRAGLKCVSCCPFTTCSEIMEAMFAYVLRLYMSWG